MLKRTTGLWRSAQGFSLVDQLATLAILATVCAIAVPALSKSVENQRLSMEARNVEREMQLARLNAVTTNRPIRVRFNCPTAGQYRRVELIGSVNNPETGDDADNQGARRCALNYYPYPAADKDPLTRPNNDGPLLQLNSKVVFTSVQTLEFWPNGTVHVSPGVPSAQPWPQLSSAAPVNIILTQASNTNTQTRSVSVNTLGKMQIQ